eukprot:Em0006g830a
MYCAWINDMATYLTNEDENVELQSADKFELYEYDDRYSRYIRRGYWDRWRDNPFGFIIGGVSYTFTPGLSMSILVEFVTDDMTLISITPGCSLSNSNSMQVEKGMHQADHHHGPLAHMLCLVYQEEHLMTQWLTAHSKNMDLAGCPEVKVRGQVVSQVTGQVVLQVTGQVVLQVTGQVVSQVMGQVVSQVTGQVVLQVTGQVVLQVTGQVVLQVTGQVVLQALGQHLLPDPALILRGDKKAVPLTGPTSLSSATPLLRSIVPRGTSSGFTRCFWTLPPKRVVPPLKPPISLDATVSEFQRFLSRIAAHKVLSPSPKATPLSCIPFLR